MKYSHYSAPVIPIPCLPRNLTSRILVVPFCLLPSRNMNVQKHSILLSAGLLRNINHLFRASLYREIGVRATEIGT